VEGGKYNTCIGGSVSARRNGNETPQYAIATTEVSTVVYGGLGVAFILRVV